MTATRLYRSLLYVPGNKPNWIEKAPSYGPDALILDLEDSVPMVEKDAARELVGGILSSSPPLPMFVRASAWASGGLLADLRAIVHAGLTGVMLPKTRGPEDVAALDRVLTEFEAERGLPVGGIEIVPLLETADGMRRSYEVFTSSQRIRRITGVGNHSPGADYYRALGTIWSPEGHETLYTDLKYVVDARSAGIDGILCPSVSGLKDLDHVRRVHRRAKGLGANGASIVYPAHIASANEAFTPSAEEIDEARGILLAMAEAAEESTAAVNFRGRMVDIAHARTALVQLELAKSYGIDVGEYPTLGLD